MLGGLLMAVVKFLAWLIGRLCDLAVLAVELVAAVWGLILWLVAIGINVVLALAAVYVLLKLMAA
jgi:hypothetical protein